MVAQNRQFAHLLPEDREIWKRFLSEYGEGYTSFEYDVRVGKGRDPGDSVPANIQKMAIDLSQRRIDAIGHQINSVTIFEITASCGFTAIGQVFSYPILYKLLYAPTVEIRSAIVAGRIQDDIKPVLDSLQITYFLI